MGFGPGARIRRALARILAFLVWPFAWLLAKLRSARSALGAGGLRDDDAAAVRASLSARHAPKSSPLLDLEGDEDEGAGTGDDDSAYGRDDAGARRFEWIGQDDLEWFKARIAPVEGRLMDGGAIGDGWSLMMDKHVPGEVKYVAYMRPLPNGTTEYLSATLAPDTTAAEMAEFFADDAERLKWDAMLHRTQLVEPGRNLQRQAEQIILWHRKYPFAFLKDRWYCIARKIFAPPGAHGAAAPHYGVSKVVPHPVAEAYAADEMPGVKRIDEFYSMWASRTVPSPWPAPGGGGGVAPPACLTVLLHHDNMKVPESLARVAIRTGMWKFLRGMVAATKPWVAARRARVSPFEDDPDAACRRATGGADGRQPALSAVYGHDGTAAPLLAPAAAPPRGVRFEGETAAGAPPAGAPAAAGAPAWAARRHDAASLHAVATAPGDLQHMAALASAREARAARAAARAAAAAEAEAEEAAAASRWPADSSSASSLSSAASYVGGAAGLTAWMGWLPRGRRPPPRPAAPAPRAAPAAPAPPRVAEASPARGRRGALPPSEALATAAPEPASPSSSSAPAPGGGLPRLLSDPGLYRPGKVMEEGTQTWLPPGAGGARVPARRPRTALGGLARSIAAGAAAGVAVLLLARAAEAAPARPRGKGRARAHDDEGAAAAAAAAAAEEEREEERFRPWRDGAAAHRPRAAATRRRLTHL